METIMRSLIKFLLFSLLSCPIKADSEIEPSKIINTLHNALTNIMKMADEETPTNRYSYLEPIISKSFDFNKIARLVTGGYWKKASEQEQQEFEKSLRNLAISSYVSNFDNYSGHHFKLTKKNISNRRAVIETSLTDADGETTRIKYMLHKKKGDWLIINVVARGVSDLSLKRADYIRFLKSNSLGNLAKTLNHRAKKAL